MPHVYTLSQWQPITQEQYCVALVRLFKQMNGSVDQVVIREEPELATYDTPRNPDSLETLGYVTEALLEGEEEPAYGPYLMLLEIDPYDDGSDVGKVKCFVRRGVALHD